jgi:hypothetical protein
MVRNDDRLKVYELIMAGLVFGEPSDGLDSNLKTGPKNGVRSVPMYAIWAIQ